MQGYQILETIYQSERVSVIRAIRDLDGKSVVLKALNGDFPSIRDSTRIKYEFELSEKAMGTGIVPVLELTKQLNKLILVMEDVGGIPLLDYWNSTPKILSIFLNLSIQITQILGNLHGKGILHKDIKPANVLVQKETGKVYLIDLGLASLLQSEEQAPVQPETLEGTLSYISPEQTGRMNRSIDSRSDLYSLGVTFYELLTGRLPFLGTDPLEQVHAHIALSPVPPIEIQPQIPNAISNLILKLLSKNAEDRYMSAKGLQEDLELSRELLLNEKPIEFVPGERESRGIFSIPQKLYGREAETSFLLDAFERISSSLDRIPEEGDTEGYGETKLVLVGGYSGVGKTALINEIHKPILEKRGYFLSGKFDQFKRNIPYYSLIQAFTRLVRQILTEKEEKIQRWKTRILGSCSPNVVLLTDLIPELIHITGTQSPVNELPPREAEDRFQKTLQDFVDVFASIEHPLVIFLDDLQWADLPTLKFLENIVLKNEVNHLLLIGAFRDNEVDTLHPFTLMVQALEKEQIKILKIALAPLDEFFIERMICDTIHREVGSELPELVYKKTGGNPFFVRQLLTTLYRDKHLYYSKENRWEYDLEGIVNSDYSENVVEVVANRLKELSQETQEVLKVASCIGDRFELSLLTHVLQLPLREIVKLLQEASKEGVVLPINQSYKALDILGTNTKNVVQKVEFKFIHDRVQQAAKSLFSDEEKNSIHVKIGKSLLEGIDPESLHEQIFEIVNHLNHGLSKFTVELGSKVVNLNFIAGEKAMEAFAYESAYSYYSLAEKYYKNYIDTNPNLFFNITFKLYLSKYNVGIIDDSENELLSLLEKSDDIHHKFLVYNQLIVVQTNLGKMSHAIKTCTTVMKLFNLDIKESPSKRDIFINFKRIQKKVFEMDTETLLSIPELEDKNLKIAMEILMNSAAAAYWQNPEFGILCSLIMVELTLEHGNSYPSAFGYSIFGVALLNFGEYDRAYQFGKLALVLNDRYQNPSILVKVPLVFAFSINIWKNHSKKSYNILMDTFKKYSHLNDKVFLGSALSNALLIQFLIGENFLEVKLNSNHFIEYFKKSNLRDQFYWSYMLLTFSDEIMDNDIVWINLEGISISENQYIDVLQSIQSKVGIHLYYTLKMFICYLNQDIDGAYSNGSKAAEYRVFGVGMLHSSHEIFIYTLTLIRYIETIKSEKIIEEIERNINQFKKWSDTNEANFLYRYLFLLGEYQRYQKLFWDALINYERALEYSIKNNYNLDSGIISEKICKFIYESGMPFKAKEYLQKAMYYYDLCGAKSLIQQLRIQNPSLVDEEDRIIDKKSITTRSVKVTQFTKQFSIDTQSILKANQAISEEINLESLVKKLINLTIENAGATRGVLLLYEGDNLFIEAVGKIDNKQIETYKDLSVKSYTEIPQSLIQYAIRTSKTIILDSAIDDSQFGENPYLQREKILSLICMPIITKGRTIGFLYLENNLLKRAFTKDRLETLNLITAQGAITIENARLYDSMEEKVLKRTKELELQKIALSDQKVRLEKIQNYVKSIQNTPDFDNMASSIKHIFKDNYNFSIYSFYICNSLNNNLQMLPVASGLEFPDEVTRILANNHIPLNEERSIHITVMKNKRAFYARKLRTNNLSLIEKINLDILKISSIFIVPLIVSGKVFALLSFCDTNYSSNEHKSVYNLTQNDREDIELLCQSIASGLYQSIQKKELETQKRYIEGLNYFLKNLNNSNDLNYILNEIHFYIQKHFKIHHYALGLVDSTNTTASFIESSLNLDYSEKEKLKSLKLPITGVVSGHAYAFKANKPIYIKKVRSNRMSEEERITVKICKVQSILILPLVTENKNIGYIDLFNYDSQLLLSADEILRLSILSEQLSGIIYRTNLNQALLSQNEKIEKTNQRAELSLKKSNDLNDMIQVIIKSKNTDEVFQRILDLFSVRYGLTSYLVYELDKLNGYLKLYKIYTYYNKNTLELIEYRQILNRNYISIYDKDSVHGVCIKTKKSFLTKKVRLPHQYKPEEENIRLGGIQSFYIIPLISDEEAFGALTFSDNKFERSNIQNISKSDRDEIEYFIKLISPSIFQSLQKKELETQKKSIEELNKFIKNLNESHDFEKILEKTKSYINKYFNIDHYAIGLTTIDKRHVKFLDTSLTSSIEIREKLRSFNIPIVNTLGAHAFAYKSNKPLYIKVIKSNRVTVEEKQIIDLFQFKSILIIPLILNGNIIGFLDLSNKDKELSLTKEQINQLSILAEQLAGIIYSSNLYQELQSQKQQLESTLTELRTTQVQLVEAEKSAALGQLISGVAHEINNPLAAIRSSAEILEMDQARILEDLPKFFQSASPETLSLFLELQAQSSKNKKYLPSREERQRKKKIRSTFETIPFDNPMVKEEIIDLVSELFLEDSYFKMIEQFSGLESLQILQIVSLFSTQKNALKNIRLSTEKSARVIFSLRKYLGTDIKGTPREIRISELIESSLRTYDNYIQGIMVVEKDYAEDGNLICVVDEIQQVLKNLVFNAVQSMYTSPIKKLRIVVQKVNTEFGEKRKISLEDSGVGVGEDVVQNLFTPFFTTKSRGEGIGLGLYVSKKIVEEHGGKLVYEKMEGGSRFVVEI
jgi:histidine kinase